jgi:hypothetical protein
MVARRSIYVWRGTIGVTSHRNRPHYTLLSCQARRPVCASHASYLAGIHDLVVKRLSSMDIQLTAYRQAGNYLLALGAGMALTASQRTHCRDASSRTWQALERSTLA